jgi:hypothetical protein
MANAAKPIVRRSSGKEARNDARRRKVCFYLFLY